MVQMIVQHQVKNFEEWKQVFDSVAGDRKRNGEISSQVYRSDSDPNQVAAIFKWDSQANANKYTQSPELKAAMERAGVTGHHSISFFSEA